MSGLLLAYWATEQEKKGSTCFRQWIVWRWRIARHRKRFLLEDDLGGPIRAISSREDFKNACSLGEEGVAS